MLLSQRQVMERSFRYCGVCRRQAMAWRAGPNHILHLILTVITGGIWLIVWIGSFFRVGGWQCESCGTRQSSVLVAFLMIGIAVAVSLLLLSANPYYRDQLHQLIFGKPH